MTEFELRRMESGIADVANRVGGGNRLIVDMRALTAEVRRLRGMMGKKRRSPRSAPRKKTR